MAVPSHTSPPLAGAGLSHDLTRDRIPLPHVTSHTPQDVHPDHAPSTDNQTEWILLPPIDTFSIQFITEIIFKEKWM